MNVIVKHVKEIVVFLVLLLVFYVTIFGKFESNRSFRNIGSLRSDENGKSIKDMRKPNFWLEDFFGEKNDGKTSPKDIKR